MSRACRSWIRLGLAAILCGAVLNVFVAWGVAAATVDRRVHHGLRDLDIVWPQEPPAGWPAKPDVCSDAYGPGFTCASASENFLRAYLEPPFRPGHDMTIETYGVPRRSLKAVRLTTMRDGNWHELGTVLSRGLVLGSKTPFDEMRLAFVPMWPGFAINTLLYATLPWLVMCVVVRRRRANRRRRGRCVRCNYDLAGLVSCAECGTPA